MEPAAPAPSEDGIDPKRFWQAIGCRAVGAAVVTARDDEGPAGFLALSATHLSANPPRMMVSIDLRTSALKTIAGARHFAINYLAQGHEELVGIFGGKTELTGARRFVPERWTTLRTGAPALIGAVGVLDCRLEETIERGGTVIAIGRLVAHVEVPDLKPLVSFRGGYL